MEDRKSLWSSLLDLASHIDSPWILMGDFNCYRYDYEKGGGVPSSTAKVGELNSFIFNSGLQDLKSVGLLFTWFNQRSDSPIHIKLDRMLINPSFLDLFPMAYYKVDAFSGSDHAPIILLPSMHQKAMTRFMFKEFWLNLDNFWEVLLLSFEKPVGASPISAFYDSLKFLKCAIRNKNWASANFLSNTILQLKNQQALCLDYIQRDPINPELNLCLKNTNEQLNAAHLAWSSWISQRAKAYWLSQGEDDLGFLYSKIRARGNCNMIKELLTPSGLLSTHSEIAHALVDHFKALFNANPPPLENSFILPVGNTVPAHALASLVAPVSNEEIKSVVFGGVASSAPGPDGFSFTFYQKTWLITGFKLCSAVKHFFSTGFLPRGAKATVISLIPKGTHSNSISDYRPISLCNVFYKIIAKIIANRLKPILPLIINESQYGFITKRCSTDNIILASEILREFKSHKRYFCAKLDVKKAFDSVSRSFLLNRLIQKGFPDIFIKWIRGCISDVYFSISVNGTLEGFFNSSSGLRQGCPLSPLLFCIAMDGLSACLDNSQVYSFKGINNHNCSFSHLLYADDLLVFGEASKDNTNVLNEILVYFSKASGLFINADKSSLIFSKNFNDGLAVDLAANLGISKIDDCITYLGIPISTGRLKLSHFQPLMNKIVNHLEGWKVKFLSFAGRVQFLKFTIANTIAYWIRGSILPKACCKFIKKICAKFLFFGNINEKRLHLISWKSVAKPKQKGGLGLPTIEYLYHNMMCSFIFRMYNCDNMLGVWFKGKFCSPWKPPPTCASKFWKFCCLKAAEIKDFISLEVHCNSNLSFFWDPWCHQKSISELACPSTFSNLKLKEVISNNLWTLPEGIPGDIILKIMTVELSSKTHTVYWLGAVSQTLNNFSKFYFSDMEDVSWAKYIWHKGFALRYASYAWMAILRKLKTADLLLSRGISVTAECSFCSYSRECHSHLFFECDFSFKLITELIPALENFYLRPNLFQVYEFLSNSGCYSRAELNFCFLAIAVLVYWIWRERNSRRFSNTWKGHSELKEVISQAIHAKTVKWKNYDSLKDRFSAILD
ncbi:Putative ribonuclease H protein [Dendrobium catenatum]|uniref:Ribonuclease H protein n=1 Tax=Dendrobium catenatum TaxID=906689 RepID=A0A2I0VC09_9ASPA|nr:Putative ribonuclease H protein [Dendrobium catenatum]